MEISINKDEQTGSTPIMLYSELIRLHREEELGFSNVVTFNL